MPHTTCCTYVWLCCHDIFTGKPPHECRTVQWNLGKPKQKNVTKNIFADMWLQNEGCSLRERSAMLACCVWFSFVKNISNYFLKFRFSEVSLYTTMYYYMLHMVLFCVVRQLLTRICICFKCAANMFMYVCLFITRRVYSVHNMFFAGNHLSSFDLFNSFLKKYC